MINMTSTFSASLEHWPLDPFDPACAQCSEVIQKGRHIQQVFAQAAKVTSREVGRAWVEAVPKAFFSLCHHSRACPSGGYGIAWGLQSPRLSLALTGPGVVCPN
jgi:hypothetical protein